MPTANNTRALWPVLVIVVAVLAAGSCSTSTTTSGLSLVNEQGNHPAGWIASHLRFALPDGSICVSCHGSVTNASQSGGISGVSCFLSSRSGQGCHAGGPTFLGIHAVPFPTPEHFQATDNTFAAVCANCHGIDPPSPLATAPACRTCHVAGSPLTFLVCSSCHTEPPSGTSYPNVEGGHATHNALAGGTGVCDSCHNGLGSGTAGHYDRANARPGKDALRVPPGEVVFQSFFNAKSGTPSFDNVALTCTNVSCHGGQQTPTWQTGSINVNADCTLCHASGTGQFNGYFSGFHEFHVFFFPFLLPDVIPTCVVCHDTTKLADPAVGAHFDNLVTTSIDTQASVTIGGGSTLVQTYVPGATAGTGSCMPTNTSTDIPACHATRAW